MRAVVDEKNKKKKKSESESPSRVPVSAVLEEPNNRGSSHRKRKRARADAALDVTRDYEKEATLALERLFGRRGGDAGEARRERRALLNRARNAVFHLVRQVFRERVERAERVEPSRAAESVAWHARGDFAHCSSRACSLVNAEIGPGARVAVCRATLTLHVCLPGECSASTHSDGFAVCMVTGIARSASNEGVDEDNDLERCSESAESRAKKRRLKRADAKLASKSKPKLLSVFIPGRSALDDIDARLGGGVPNEVLSIMRSSWLCCVTHREACVWRSRRRAERAAKIGTEPGQITTDPEQTIDSSYTWHAHCAAVASLLGAKQNAVDQESGGSDEERPRGTQGEGGGGGGSVIPQRWRPPRHQALAGCMGISSTRAVTRAVVMLQKFLAMDKRHHGCSPAAADSPRPDIPAADACTALTAGASSITRSGFFDWPYARGAHAGS